MRFVEKIKPIAELRETSEPLMITQNGEATGVIQDNKSDADDRSTLELLKLLAMGRKQIEEGKFSSAKDVFARMDKEIFG